MQIDRRIIFISMNNSLVKEYFRAVKEIRPKAFVMENVSMLSPRLIDFMIQQKIMML